MDLLSLRHAMAGWPVGHTVLHRAQVSSTMTWAHAHLHHHRNQTACAGTVVVADEQTMGRGRLQRRWEAPPGQALLLSVIVAGVLLPPAPAHLPMIAGIAVLDAVRAAVPPLARHLWIKWPNDLLILGDGAAAKLAGVLVEGRLDAVPPYAVIGIGMNVNQTQDGLPQPRTGGLPPTSLQLLLGRRVSRADLLVALCRSLGHYLAPPDRPAPDVIHAAWQRSLINMGQSVVVRWTGPAGAPSEVRGQVVGTSPLGELLVEDEQGTHHAVGAGDASFQWQC